MYKQNQSNTSAFKIPSLMLVSLSLCSRIFGWCMSQPDFDPSENLACLIRVKSCDTTKQSVRGRVLVVSKSLCGYVSNKLQYNMESAQYLG